MRKTYLFALLALILVVAFVGSAIAAPMPKEARKAYEKANKVKTERLNTPLRSSSTNLDELTVIYETTFETADGWTIVDGGDVESGTWACISENDNTPDELEANAPFMFVDSDNDGHGFHMIETLISPAFDAGTHPYIYLSTDILYNGAQNNDSLVISYSLDGTNFTEFYTFFADEQHFPGVWDISEFVAGESSFQIAFRYDDGNGWEYWAGIDNFKILGSDVVEDFMPPVVEITAGPSIAYEGFEDLTVIANATDDVELTGVYLLYGIIVESSIPDLQTVAMTATGNPDEFSAIIPADFGTAGDEIGYVVMAEDAAENQTYDPAGGSSVYPYDVWPLEYTSIWMETNYSFTDISADGTVIAEGDDVVGYIDLTTLEGFNSFNYLGDDFTEITVNSNGWIAFGHETYEYAGITLGSTSTPNNIIALCADDFAPNQATSGDIYYKVVDGNLIIQYGTPEAGIQFYDEDFGPTMQVVLGSDGSMVVNYHTIVITDGDGDPYTDDHKIGHEVSAEAFNYVLYTGVDYTDPVDGSSYAIRLPIMGGISGVVTATSGGSVLEGVTVTAMQDEVEAGTATTDAEGAYSIVLNDGTYDVVFEKTGYETLTSEDVVVADNEMSSLDVSLDDETTVGTLSGVIYSADTDNPIEGILVELVEAELSMTTGDDGAYSFADVAIGDYTITINSGIGLATYHDLTADVTITETMDPVDFSVNVIMAPENLQPTVGNGSVVLTFDAPANHAAPEVVMGYINELELIVSLHDQNLKLADNIDEVREQLSVYRNIYENLTSTSLDEISDLAGYRVKVDGTLRDNVYPSETIAISGLTNDQQYTFAVAADYGYGDELLLFTADVNATPVAPDPYRYEVVPYNWVEIRTNDLGTDAGFTSDDVYTDWIEFPGGTTFSLYGVPYSQFRIGSNGYISFVETGSTHCDWDNVDIPNTDIPNGFIAPHWDWTDTYSDGNTAYYYFDTENNEVVFTWYLEVYASTNRLEYQLILDLDTNEMVFNYNSASDGWPTITDPNSSYPGATIGVENEDGTDGLRYFADPTDNFALRFTQAPLITGTVSGVVKHATTSGDAIEDVEVWIDGQSVAVDTTDNTGAFSFTAAIGDYDLIFVHDDYWTVEEEDVTVTEGNNTDLGEVFMTKPIPGVTPSSFEITYNITTGGAVSETFDLSNSGTGPMEYFAGIQILQSANVQETPVQPVEIRNTPDFAKQRVSEEVGPVYTGSSLDDTWDLIQSYEDIETGTGAGDNLGICLTENNFYVAGFFYATVTKFAFNGSVVSSETIPDAYQSTSTDYPGFNDIASDPDGYFYGANDDGKILKFNEDFSEVVELADLDFWGITLAYDYDNSLAYVSNFGSSFTKVDASGNTTALSSIAGAYGMTYVPNDPDGYTIYAHVDGDDGNSYVYRYDPSNDVWESEPIFTAYDLSGTRDNPGGIAGGARATGSFDFILTKQDTETDFADMYEGYPLQQWVTVSPAEGTISAGSSQQMTVTVNADNDPEFDYEDGETVYANIIVSGPHMNDVTVVATINFVVDSATEVVGIPNKYALHQNYPNPFNPTTEIKFDLVQAQNVKLVVFNTLGQEVARLMDAPMQAGYHVVTFDASTFASGVYFYRIETEAFTSMKKMVMVK